MQNRPGIKNQNDANVIGVAQLSMWNSTDIQIPNGRVSLKTVVGFIWKARLYATRDNKIRDDARVSIKNHRVGWMFDYVL